MRYYEDAFVRKHRKEVKMPAFLFALGLFLEDRLDRRRSVGFSEDEMYRALLLGEDARRVRAAARISCMLLLILAGVLLAGTMLYLEHREESMARVERPGFGEEERVSVKVEGLSRDQEITFPVSGKDPDRQEADAVFDAAFREMEETWLAGNESFLEIRSRLNLPDKTASGIRIRYKSGIPEALTDYGMILAEKIPEEGIPGTLSVTLSYGGFEKTYEISLKLLPEKEAPLSEEEELRKLLSELDEKTRQEAWLELPEEISGRKIRFFRTTASPYAVLCFFLILSACLYIFPNERVRKAYRERNKEIENSYPNLLMKLETLIRAGLSIRSAWERIASDYEAGRKKGSRKKEYVYEEMRITAFRMQQGESETEAYVNFGRRMGTHSYMKLGNMLSRSIRQGISGLTDSFDEEMTQALERQKNAALRAGEEAGTKVLFPMMLMLGVVIVSLVVPAFMSFRG